MLKLTQFNFTEKNTRYFSNVNQLAKDIKKIIVFLSNREKNIFDELDKIKHTQLLQIISKSLGEKYYENNSTTTAIDLSVINKLIAAISTYITQYTKIKEEFIVEVFELLFLNIDYSVDNNLKKNIMKKINVRLKHLENFEKLDIYENFKRNNKEKLNNDKLRELITEKNYILYKNIYYQFIGNFETYYKIINKKYHFVWYPYAFEKFRFSFDQVEENKLFLEKAKIYHHFIEMKHLLHDLIMANNINLFNHGNIEETYYIQDQDTDLYVEILLDDYQTNVDYHGGYGFAHIMIGDCPFTTLKKEYLKVKNDNNILLKKITWDGGDYFNTTIHTYEKKTLQFFCTQKFIAFHIYSENGVTLKHITFKEKIDRIKSFSHFGTKSYDTSRMKNFFLFGREQDFLEYQFFNNNNLIYTVQFRIDNLIIKNTGNKIIMPYKELLFEEDLVLVI